MRSEGQICPSGGEDQSGQKVRHLDLLVEHGVDAHAENQSVSHQGDIVQRRLGDEGCNGGCQQGHAALEQKDWEGGEDTPLTHGSSHNEDDDAVQNCFGHQHGAVSGQSILDGANDGHGADADGEGGGNKGVHKFVVAAVAALLPQKRPKGLGGGAPG